MKRFIALFIITIFMSVQGVYAKNTEQKTEISSDINNDEIYKIYSDSLDKLFDSKSFETNSKYSCIRNGEKASNVKVDFIVKQINKGVSDFDIYINTLTSYNLFSDSIKHIEKNDIYYKDGYIYGEESGEKIKQKFSFCEMLSNMEDKQFYLSLVKNAIKDTSIKSTDDGGKEIKFDIYYDKVSSFESSSEGIKYKIEVLLDMLELETMNFEDIKQDNFKYIVKINKDGLIVSGSLSCDLKTIENEIINFNYDFNISNINNSSINFPNLNNYISIEEYMEEYYKKYYKEQYDDYKNYGNEEGYDEEENYDDYYNFFEYGDYDIKKL